MNITLTQAQEPTVETYIVGSTSRVGNRRTLLVAAGMLPLGSVGGSTTGGVRTDDQSCFCLSELGKHIGDLAWNTFLIGTGVSAFTTGDIWVIPSILAPLWVSPATCRRLFVTAIGS
jgi:hypothetical protein